MRRQPLEVARRHDASEGLVVQGHQGARDLSSVHHLSLHLRVGIGPVPARRVHKTMPNLSCR